MSKNQNILNPYTGEPSYGIIPELSSRGIIFPEGHIHLRKGEHRGPQRGFGVEHIWAAHEKELRMRLYIDKTAVARFVADIIQPNAALHCEFENLRGNHRIGIIKNSLGVVYVEQKPLSNNSIVYSVVTAFTNAKAHGTQIGRVLACVTSSSSDSLAQMGSESTIMCPAQDPLEVFRPNEEANSK